MKMKEISGKKRFFSQWIKICNVLCIDNPGSFVKLATRITSCLYDLNLLKTSIVHDDNSDIGPEILCETTNEKSSNILKNSSISNTSVQNTSYDEIRSDSGSIKNEMPQLLI